MKNNRTSAINNNIVVKKDIENVNDVVDNNVIKDVDDNDDVIVEKVVNNDDYGYDYWDSVREVIFREREEERRLKYLRKHYNKTEVAKLKAIIDNKNNDDNFDFDFDNWVFDESGKQVDIAEKAKRDLWDFYGVKYNGNHLNLKKFNCFMGRMDDLYCDVHGGLKQDCVECNK